MSDTNAIEDICRIICTAEGVDPDRESVGCGGVMPRDQKYKLWEARKRVAEALVAAGYVRTSQPIVDGSETIEPETPIARLERDCSEAYQAVGTMANALGWWEMAAEHPWHLPIEKLLDNLSKAAEGDPRPHEDLLPFILKTPTADSNKSGALTTDVWCLVTPISGQPRLMPACLSDTADYVKSDAVEMCTVGSGNRPGESWEVLEQQGYRIARVRIEEIKPPSAT
jgi:hypothetical protein